VERYFLLTPTRIDWADIAHTARPDFDPARPDTALLRSTYEELFGGSLIYYDAPLPSTIPSRHYYVLADSGVVEVIPQGLRGTIAVAAEPPGWSVGNITFTGALEAASPTLEAVGEPGFSAFHPTVVSIRSAPAPVGGTTARPTVLVPANGEHLVLAFDSTRASLRNPGWGHSLNPVPTAARLFEFLETGQRFVSVRWDGEACYGAHVLYDITTAVPRFVVEHFGYCDE